MPDRRPGARVAVALSALLSFSAFAAEAQNTTGLLVVAHGAGPEWNSAVRTSVGAVQWEGPVEIAFLMGPEATTAGWDSALVRLERTGVARLVVVPLMVSSYGAHFRQIQHYAGQLEHMPAELMAHNHSMTRPKVPVVMTAALDGAPEMAEALAFQHAALSEADRRRAVVVIGHGPSSDADAARWMEQLDRVGARIAGQPGAPAVRAALLKDDADAPVRAAAIAAMRDTISALSQRTGDSVLVISALIARSALTRTTIPADIAGLPVRYNPTALTPHPAIAAWIQRVATAASQAATQTSAAHAH